MKYNTKQTFKIYLQHIRKYRFIAFVTIFATISATIVNIVVPLYFKRFFDLLASGESNEINVIDGGKIIEEGSHKELIKHQKGLYKRLWKVQAGGFLA
ncbi:hypothetical protein KKA94_03065 [Patescibacteria group bacterium]|nr:hypothetical protein [Patescibacteria group bacterium]